MMTLAITLKMFWGLVVLWPVTHVPTQDGSQIMSSPRLTHARTHARMHARASLSHTHTHTHTHSKHGQMPGSKWSQSVDEHLMESWLWQEGTSEREKARGNTQRERQEDKIRKMNRNEMRSLSFSSLIVQDIRSFLLCDFNTLLISC